ncbi:ataxin-7-like protein 1 isoform X2 [Alosa pseudoharengus]|uniref:ataxin-7-like protein 1 isoform X2 n=1 Tax=Alosa pseudoharengus TaxID=34774 RepID=UPI003F8BE614
MATLDRQLPSLDTFLCKPWSIFTDAAESLYTDNMHLFGQFPTHDEFLLVVCNVCEQVIKPQGFLTHYERRHGSPGGSRAPLVPMKPKESVSHSGVEALPFRVPRDYPHSRFSKAPLAVYPPKGARAKACVSMPVVSLEKMPCFGRAEGSHVKVSSGSSAPSTSSFPYSSSSSSSSQSPAASLKSSSLAFHKPQEKFVNGRGPATPRSVTPPSAQDGLRRSPSRSPLDKRPTPSPSASQDRRPSASPSPSSLDRRPSTSPSLSSLDRRPSAPPSPLEKKHQNGTKGSQHKRVSGRIFDPNKHCGVLDPETKRACTRSLTCKTHSLTHRRAVPGRKKDFDVLLAEHKGRAKEKDGGHKRESQTGSQLNQSHDTTPSGPAHCPNDKTTSTLRLRLANTHMHRSVGSGGAMMLSSSAVPAPDPAPSWQRAAAESRLSSDEGETEASEDPEKPTCHYSPRHPHPMSCCAFNSRLMGRGHYVFDRRWDKIRLVLHSMVEKHVNSQMWKKVPLAAESLASNSPSPSDSSSSSSGVLFSPLFASPAAPPSLDGVSVVSYSTAFPHNGGGIFCIKDPDPPTPASSSSSSSSFAKPPRTKPAKSPRAQSEGPGAKRRKPSEGSSHRKNGNGYHPPASPLPPPSGPAIISNGTATLCIKSKSPSRIGQGLKDAGRYASGGQVGAGSSLQGDHVLTTHGPTPFSSMAMDGRKRKSSGLGEKSGKVTKTAGLDSIFRKSSLSLLAPLPESPHNPHLRQPKVHH